MNEKVKLKEIDNLMSVFVNDFLSTETMDVFSYAKSLKDVGLKFVFARGGNVFVKKDVQARLIRIKSMDDIDQLLLKSSGGGKKIIVLMRLLA